MQPVPKAAYRSDFRENTETCQQRGFDRGTSRAAGKRHTTDHRASFTLEFDASVCFIGRLITDKFIDKLVEVAYFLSHPV